MLQEYKNIHDQMQEILAKMKPEDSNITFEIFLSKLGTTEEVYILAIGSSLQKPKGSQNEMCLTSISTVI